MTEMDDFDAKQSNLNQLNEFTESDFDIPISEDAISRMYELVQMCEEYDLPQPEIYPWSGGKGIQAEWNNDWYIEVSTDGNKIYFYASNDGDDNGNIECLFENISNVMQLLKLMFTYILS